MWFYFIMVCKHLYVYNHQQKGGDTMILKEVFNESISKTSKLYLEIYPYSISNQEYAEILYRAYPKMKEWTLSIKKLPSPKMLYPYLLENGSLWLETVENEIKVMTLDVLVVGIERALFLYEDELVNKSSICPDKMSEELCDRVIQLALFNQRKYS